MAKIFISIALLLQLCTIQGSPCSEYYTYLTKPGTNEILGRIEIPSPPNNTRYYLRVGFNIHPLIHRNEPIARLEIIQPIEETIEAVQQRRSLLYHIHFPVDQAIPRLTKIWFNGQQLCPNEGIEYPKTTVVVEQIYLSSVKPPSLNSPLYQDSNVNINSSPILHLSEGMSKKIILKTIRTKKSAQYNDININHINNNNECSISDGEANLMVVHGKRTSSEQWPWLIALFKKSVSQEEDYEFKCSGSILTNKHVITAAHCTSQINNVHPNALVVLGKFNRSQYLEQETIKREIASYTVHPDYTYTTNGDSDLAILILKRPVEFCPFIAPVSLWSGPISLQNIINKTGYIVGWGMNEWGDFPEEPQMAEMPIVNQETCLGSHKRFMNLTSERTFCAGWRNNSGPCNGDSGSGLVLFNNITKRYELRGLVSRSLRLYGNILSCDLQNYIVYVDVAKYIPWIQEQISMENRPTSAKLTPQTIVDNNYNECGISGYREDTLLLIAKGQDTLPGQWPWLVALFKIYDVKDGYEFICAGTLLTTKHVLTAAHCLLFGTNDTIHPNVLEVALGRFNLHYFREEETVIRKVASYKIHPDYMPHAITGDSNLAILILRTPVEFNPFIRPICLWTGSTTLENIIGETGYVVGWGLDEYANPFPEQPRMVRAPIVSQETCFSSNRKFIQLITENTFCAGSKDNSGPCNGDSGSGLVLLDDNTDRYHLRGIVSRSLRLVGRNISCDLQNYIVYVDVAKYIHWIQAQISMENTKPTLVQLYKTLQNIDNNNECGISDYKNVTSLNSYIHDVPMIEGQWPWLAAIFTVRNISNGYEFLCGGTILTTSHVLTAANCLKLPDGNYTIHPSVLEVAFGQFDLHQYHKEDTVIREVASYKIHGDYMYGESGDSDLAILMLRTPIEFDRFIRPICLWSGSTTLQDVVGRTGYVVGWGRRDSGHLTAKSRMVKAPIVSQATCLWSHRDFFSLTSERTFCAGLRAGSDPCIGDTGTSLVLFDSLTGRYQLRGVVSRSLYSFMQCNPYNYVVYVDVANYISWIRKQIGENDAIEPTSTQPALRLNM